MTTYNLFISHSWTYSDAYDRLVDLLKAKPYFTFKNYSVPKNDPIHNAQSQVELANKIKLKMQPASCVLILSGVYSTYSKWINIEIELAKSMDKKIIAIQPWGAERTSKVVKDNADEIVGWNTDSVIKAIKNQ